MKRSIYFRTLGIIIAIGSLFGACQTDTNKNTQNRKSTNLDYKKVQVYQKNIHLSVHCSGRLALQQEIYLSFKIGGRIEKLYVRKGTQVSQGQLLASLYKEDIQERYQQAKENHTRLKNDLARLEKLYTQNIGTLQKLEELRSAVEIASSNLNIAHNYLQDANLYAPGTGIILEKFQETGEVAAPGRPVFKLSGKSTAYIFKATMPDRSIVQTHLGDSCEIRFSAYPDTPVSGKITHIATTPHPVTGLFEAEISFSSSPLPLQLKPGFLGEARIFSRQHTHYHFIPAEALVEANKREGKVYIKDAKGELKTVKVKIAHILDQEIAIGEGLENIDEVIIP